METRAGAAVGLRGGKLVDAMKRNGIRRAQGHPFPLCLVVVSLLVLAGCSAASNAKPAETSVLPSFDVPVDAYVEASRSGARSTIAGKAYQERRKPNAADEPLTDTVVTLFPYSETVRAQLEALKRSARQSADEYVAAAPKIKKLRDAYESMLWHHGAADFVLTATVQPDGTFKFDDVPPGHWLLYGTRAQFTKKEGRARTGGGGRFPQYRRLEGFYTVTVWLRDVSTSRATPDTIELTDQNVWFSGVSEEWITRPRPPIGSGGR